MVENETIFHKILKKEIPSNKVYEDDHVYAFHDITPQAPFHCLVIPKKMSGLSHLDKADDSHVEILGRMLVAVSKIAKENGLENGFRTIINNGKDGQQTVDYIHIHIMGKREMKWPPG